MTSKVSKDILYGCVNEVLKHVLKNYDLPKDKRFTGSIKYVVW